MNDKEWQLTLQLNALLLYSLSEYFVMILERICYILRKKERMGNIAFHVKYVPFPNIGKSKEDY